MQNKTQKKIAVPDGTRREFRNIGGRFRGGKLAPVMAHIFREGESAILNQNITMELDPIAGRMITPITGELISVYVPAQAMDALKNPSEDYAGNTEAMRDKLLSGSPLFGLEEENEISKRLGVVPRSISGDKMVNEVCRLAHNAAVNYLRQRKYVSATQLDANSTAITPALISETVLDRLNGVLDPEDRVNGAVDLSFGNVQLPVRGLGANATATYGGSQTVTETGGEVVTYDGSAGSNVGHVLIVQEDPDNENIPKIYVELDDSSAGSVSLTDFYNAERMDALTRQMRQMVDENPQYGEEMVQRWAHGLSVDTGKVPYVLHQSQKTFGLNYRQGTNGSELDVSQSDFAVQMEFTVPVAPTELGGVVITFAVLKPDETLASQPHPFLSDTWSAINRVAAEMATDPVPVTTRELYADCDTGDEGTVMMYTGHNQLKKAYINYGFNRHLDANDVANKTALWQLEVPMSVTPESVLYPETLSHYPFADQTAEVCTYTIGSMATIRTPIVFGPTPVEELAILETADIFDEE